jgi:hypothetical protein
MAGRKWSGTPPQSRSEGAYRALEDGYHHLPKRNVVPSPRWSRVDAPRSTAEPPGCKYLKGPVTGEFGPCDGRRGNPKFRVELLWEVQHFVAGVMLSAVLSSPEVEPPGTDMIPRSPKLSKKLAQKAGCCCRWWRLTLSAGVTDPWSRRRCIQGTKGFLGL